MSPAELAAELHGLADSLDEHVSEWDAQKALANLQGRLAREGFTE